MSNLRRPNPHPIAPSRLCQKEITSGGGSQILLYRNPFQIFFLISATLKCYKLQQIKGKRTILGDLGDP
jgi:hypothetical protein